MYFHPEFADQNYKKPDFDRYLAAVEEHKPRIATVIDWMRDEQLAEVMMWAEAIAPHVETVIIIPKIAGGIARLPKTVGGKPVRLGYSVPTSYGGTGVSLAEFGRWPVHLLGGSPSEQYKLSRRLNVASVDGNYCQLMSRYNQYFVPDGAANFAKNKCWPTLRESDGSRWGDGSDTADAPYEAFRRSCEAILAMWHQLPQRRYFPVTRSMWAGG